MGPSIEQIPHNFISGLDGIIILARHEVQELGMDIEPDFSVLGGLPVHVLDYFGLGLVLQVLEGVLHQEILVIFLQLLLIIPLHFLQEIEIIINIPISHLPQIALWLKKHPKGRSLLLAFPTNLLPVLENLLGLAYRSLHEEGAELGLAYGVGWCVGTSLLIIVTVFGRVIGFVIRMFRRVFRR